MTNCWDPKQYNQFSLERSEPFYDLIQLITPNENMNVVDLGCGTGFLTSHLYDVLKPKMLLGIDSSEAMFKESKKYEKENLKFQLMKIEEFSPSEKYDLIFSNAALQWLPDHEKLFERLSHYIAPKGQIAIQVPANFDHPAHQIAAEIAREFLGKSREPSVLTIEAYAKLLYQLGFTEQVVRMQVYAHVLESTESVIEWLKGSLFTFYQSKLNSEDFNRFLELYREGLFKKYGLVKPFFLGFKRILIWGKL